jgi:hypothetical protein
VRAGVNVLEILLVSQLDQDIGDRYVLGWYYMRAKVAGIQQDLCGNPFDAIFYSEFEPFAAIPPTHNLTPEMFEGYGDCLYVMGAGDPPGPGQIVGLKNFPNVGFDCEFSHEDSIDCGLGESRTPTIRCVFPALPGGVNEGSRTIRK